MPNSAGHRIAGTAALSFVLLLAPAAGHTGGSGPQPVDLGRIEGLRDIVVRDGVVRLGTASGDYEIVALPDGKPGLAPVPEPQPAPLPSGLIPHATITAGERDIRETWLADPTDRYGHGVLGDGIEASALKAKTASGEILTYRLPGDSVFEDLTPRLADIDGDGSDEIIVVRSYLQAGAALAVFGIRGGKLDLVAESAAIGLPNRWLNPVGAGDFDGDGHKEIAVVRTPHIGGILIFYRMADGRLTEIARRPGFSTHAMGSTVLGMAAVLDLDGDGADDILLPGQTRTELFGIGYAGGVFRTIWNTPNQGRIVTSVAVADVDGNGAADVVYGLEDGSVMLLPR